MGTSDSERKQRQERTGAARAEGERRDHAPFFEVSKIVESPDMLKGWVEWFKKLNIPCAVMKTGRGYVLWRKGKEVGRTRAKNSSELIVNNIVYSFGLNPP
jgi:hypothetical protein